MAYVNPNVTTKAELKRRLGSGLVTEVYQPGTGTIPRDGRVFLEGPHYPQPHTWYAEGTMKDGKLVKVK